MYTQPQKLADTETLELRRAGGAWLRTLREGRGLSQREMAARVGIEYYTFISQLERGGGRVPPDRYEDWASVLCVDVKWFVRNLLKFYDPITYRVLFGAPSDMSDGADNGHSASEGGT